MAFTSAQMNKIVQLLGYGSKAIQAGSVIYDRVMNDRLHQLPPDGEALVISYLAQVSAIESQMNVAITRLTAEKVGDITVNKCELEDLRRERKRISREIAEHIDIPYIAKGGANVSVCV
jgi:hypothetical protein